MRRFQIPQVEKQLLDLKKRFRIPSDIPLHARVLMHPLPREKNGLGHLTDTDARKIIDEAIGIINQNTILVRYSTGDMSFFDKLGSEVILEDDNGGEPEPLPVKVEPKGILSLLMQACFAVPNDGSDGPLAKECQIYAAADSTMVQFIGKRRRQAHNHYQGYSDINSELGMVTQLDPVISNVESVPILQLADIAVYVCSRAMRGNEEDAFFKAQLKRIQSYVHRQLV